MQASPHDQYAGYATYAESGTYNGVASRPRRLWQLSNCQSGRFGSKITSTGDKSLLCCKKVNAGQ